jgi:hypothetical protein
MESGWTGRDPVPSLTIGRGGTGENLPTAHGSDRQRQENGSRSGVARAIMPGTRAVMARTGDVGTGS